MDDKIVLKRFAENGKLLNSEAKELIMSHNSPYEFANTVLSHISASTVFVTKADVEAVLVGDKQMFMTEKSATVNNKRQPDITIFKETDITGKSTTEGKVQDFAEYIKSRYVKLAHILECRADFGKAMDISRAKQLHDRDCKIIGIIYEVKTTKNGHIMLTIEDLSGTANVLVLKDSRYAGMEFVNDEVIGFIGHFNDQKTLFFPQKIVRPDVPKLNKWEPSDSSSKVMFMSDLHFGSNTFCKDGWRKAIDWLKKNYKAQGIDYLVLSGDVVDGVGVFPDQDKELEIVDIYNQYKALAEGLKEVPDDILMVMHPGNHDAVRLAEPQPAWKKAFTEYIDSNVTLVGNPITFQIEDRIITSYHGKGIDELVSSVKSVTYDNPLSAVTYMLKYRHLCPIYGGKVPLCPEKTDYLALEKVPNILVTGHVHKSCGGIYNGVRMLQAGALQTQTSYQAQMNFIPDPCKFPTVSLNTGVMEFHNFL